MGIYVKEQALPGCTFTHRLLFLSHMGRHAAAFGAWFDEGG